ncbi:hypothetical protein B4168_2836 [Anoxybacillus flavithermus]|nr:hypothetical protein B4168_2836 [Anoxybacillus flavithermus]OAO84893.1 hypothetical protein GT23_3279 [Parageobacillus thermoglucosidasius]
MNTDNITKGKEAPFLMFGFILSMIIVGILSKNIRVIFILLMNLVTTLVSVILAAKFLPMIAVGLLL